MYSPIVPSVDQVGDMGELVSFGDDSKLFVQFYSRTVIDPAQTKREGRPIHIQVPYIRIQQRGERDTYEQPATEFDKRRFAQKWRDFEAGLEQITPKGTLLATLFPYHPEVVENLRYFKIFTVEELAELNDTQVQNIGMGGMEFRAKAQAFLSASDKGAAFHKLADEVQALRLERDADRQKIAALEAGLAAAEKKSGKAA